MDFISILIIQNYERKIKDVLWLVRPVLWDGESFDLKASWNEQTDAAFKAQ